MRLLTYALILFVALPVNAKKKTPSYLDPCMTKKWQHPRVQKGREFHAQLEKMGKEEILQHVWYEFTKRPKDHVAIELLQYLIETEKDQDIKGYYGAIAVAAFDTNRSVNDLFEDLPKSRAPIKNEKMSLKEMCTLYKAAVVGAKKKK